MERNTFKILFFVQRTRIAKNGEVPVLLRITVNGERAVASLNLKVDPDKWNAVAGKSIGNTRKDYELNAHLDTIRARVMQVHRQMELDGVPISAQGVIDRYLGRSEKPKVMLLDIFREHNERCHQLAGKDFAPGTVERYETCLKHTAAFIGHKHGKPDVPITAVDHQFIVDYEFWLKTERNCSHNTTAKYLRNFKKIIRIALANDYISKDPFMGIRYKLEEVERDFLEDHEIKIIIDKPIAIERLAQVRDMFVFCCFTGLAFSDMAGLKREHLFTDNNGALWIRKRRQKTKNMCNIPVLDVAREILNRYENHPSCLAKGTLLPVICNQRMNSYLKELASICGINKEISSHTGRHSFATSVALANGVSIENVAKMLGHSDTKMTRHYARVLDKSIMRDMTVVNGKFAATTVTAAATAPTLPTEPASLTPIDALSQSQRSPETPATSQAPAPAPTTQVPILVTLPKGGPVS